MPGWISNQAVAVAKNRCITINNCNKDSGLIKAKIVENKNNCMKLNLSIMKGRMTSATSPIL